MAQPNHKKRVLDAITTHGSISPFYAINQLGNTRLSATIFNLKKEGHVISKEMVSGTNKFGDDIRYAKYIYVSGPTD